MTKKIMGFMYKISSLTVPQPCPPPRLGACTLSSAVRKHCSPDEECPFLDITLQQPAYKQIAKL